MSKSKSTMKKIARSEAQKVLNRNSETKFSTSSFNEVDFEDVSGSPTDYQVNSIAGGTGAASRIGNEIRMTNFNFNYLVKASAASTLVRCICYIPKIAMNSFTVQGNEPDIDTALDYDEIIVLYDSVKGCSTVNGNRFVRFSSNIRLGRKNGLIGRWTNNSGTSMQKNSIWLYFVSNQAVSFPTRTGNQRLVYKDL